MFFNFVKDKRISTNLKTLDSIKKMIGQTWNLSRKFPVVQDSEQTEAVNSFNLFFSKLNIIVTRILKNVVGLASLAPDLSGFSNDFKNKTEEQTQKIIDISKATKTMANRIEKIAQSSQGVSDDTVLITTEVREAFNLGNDSMKKFSGIQSDVKGLVDTITVLEENSKTIASIIDVINDISDETNILSLNARIEAVKNQSGNNGFKVIAEEISSLAKQSKNSTRDIKDQLTILSAKINETVTGVKMVEANVLAGEKMIFDANRSLESVHQHIGHLSKNMTQIKESMTLQSQDVKNVSKDIDSIANSVTLQAKDVQKISQVASQINTNCDDMILDTGIFHLSGHEKAGKVAQNIAVDPHVISFDRKLQENALGLYLIDNPFIELAYITDKTGKQVTMNLYSASVLNHETLDKGIRNNWSEKEWFQTPLKTHSVFISNVYRSSATDQFCFTVSAPIFEAESFAGVLGIDINFKNMLNI